MESGNKGDAWNAGDTVDNCIVTLVRTVVRLHFHPRNYYYQTKKNKMAEIYVKGTISEVLPLQQGDTERGHWERQDYVITQQESGRPLHFSISGHDKIANAGLTMGRQVIIRLYVESRQYTDKDGRLMWFDSYSYGGSFGQAHYDFYVAAMYAMKAPGFGVTTGYEVRPVPLRQQIPYYGQAQPYLTDQQPQSGLYGKQPSAGGYSPSDYGKDLPF